MIENGLKLSRGIARAAQLRVGQATHVDWIEGSEEGGASEVGCAWDREVVRSRGLRQCERFRRVTLVERVERAQGRQVTDWTDVSCG